MVIVAHNVTNLRDHKRRLSVLNRVLRHNLRNWMNVILGYAGELADHSDPAVPSSAPKSRTAPRTCWS